MTILSFSNKGVRLYFGKNLKKTKTMYNYKKARATTINVNTSVVGETIEEKVNRIVNNKEPISEGMPTYYTERKEGVRPETNIRTDRFEIAIEAMDKVTKAKRAQREERHKDKKEKSLGEEAKEGMNKEAKTEGGEPTSTQGTEKK